LNRYSFSGDVVFKDKFPKCHECGSDLITGHRCPGPQVPNYGPRSADVPTTPFQEIWHNANEAMHEVEEENYDLAWDDIDE
jgi:hypothetical protein